MAMILWRDVMWWVLIRARKIVLRVEWFSEIDAVGFCVGLGEVRGLVDGVVVENDFRGVWQACRVSLW